VQWRRIALTVSLVQSILYDPPPRAPAIDASNDGCGSAAPLWVMGADGLMSVVRARPSRAGPLITARGRPSRCRPRPSCSFTRRTTVDATRDPTENERATPIATGVTVMAEWGRSSTARSSTLWGVHPFLGQSGQIAIAHRGGAGEAPENTLEAFEIAITLGLRSPSRSGTRTSRLMPTSAATAQEHVAGVAVPDAWVPRSGQPLAAGVRRIANNGAPHSGQ